MGGFGKYFANSIKKFKNEIKMKIYNLKEVCNIATGKLDANKSVKNGNYPFFTCAEHPEKIDSYSFDCDAILVAGNNAKGNFHVNRYKGKFNAYQRTYVLTAKDNFDVDFIYYTLKLELKRLKEKSQGSQTKFLTLPILQNIHLPNITRDKQKSIAHILSTLDQKIAINNQINAQLEQMAKTLYDYWFVQFDFPDENGKPYKSSGGEMVYNDTLKREIPKGWEAQKISHWLQSDKSGDWGKEIQEGNYTLQVNCIRGADINAVNFQGNIEAPIRFILPKNKHKLLSPFNLVVEISGGSPTQSTGRLALISDYVLNRFDFPVICSNFCKAISLKNTDYFYQFVFMWNVIYKNDILFGWEGKTSGIKNLLFENFTEGYYECYPPLDLAKKFFEIADVFHKQQQFLLKQNQQLTQLRDFLLPMLMNGQVGVDGG